MMGGKEKLKPVSLADGSTLYMLESADSPIAALAIEEEKIRVEE
jgi:hypothetical protein